MATGRSGKDGAIRKNGNASDERKLISRLVGSEIYVAARDHEGMLNHGDRSTQMNLH
jgi:hypothetical protein